MQVPYGYTYVHMDYFFPLICLVDMIHMEKLYACSVYLFLGSMHIFFKRTHAIVGLISSSPVYDIYRYVCIYVVITIG